jgi:hypothetical protein
LGDINGDGYKDFAILCENHIDIYSGKSLKKLYDITSSEQFWYPLNIYGGFDINKDGFRADDGGSNWQRISQFNSPSNRLAICSDTLWSPAMDGFYSSVDGGYNWVSKLNDLGNSIAVYPITGKSGWISCYDFLNDIMRIYYTTDLGNNWQQKLSSTEIVTAFSCKNGYTWLAGTNGLIMKEVSKLSSVENESKTPINLRLFQNYPNPFNPTTTINFEIPTAEYVTLKVYDVLGKETATLVNERKLTGVYKMNFDGNRLASGVYIARLTAGNFSKSIKLCLMK